MSSNPDLITIRAIRFRQVVHKPGRDLIDLEVGGTSWIRRRLGLGDVSHLSKSLQTI